MPTVSTFPRISPRLVASFHKDLRYPSSRGEEQRSAVENWENEGGYFPRFPSLQNSATTVVTDPDPLATEIDRLTKTLASDFANGRVGKRYNTYQHRSRVIRQLTACRTAMRLGAR